ncbi:MAG: redoxin family protein [Planctomycetota bacterium]
MKSRKTRTLSLAVALATFAGTALPAAAAGPELTLEQAQELIAPFKGTQPDLYVGDRAPDLEVRSWVQGEPVSEFVPGHTYVVEMWATWCGPCIAAMPHLSKLSQQYEKDDAKVSFVGMNIWENGSPDERVATIEQFVKDQGANLTYGVAVEEFSVEGGRMVGQMAETWMKPADQNGIPAAFIVNGDGEIAWIGHPMTIDEPLEQIVAGEWDAKARAAEMIEGNAAQAVINDAYQAIMAGDREQGFKLIEAANMTLLKNDPATRASYAGVVAQLPNASEAEIDWALATAQRAMREENGENFSTVATLSMLTFLDGDIDASKKLMDQAAEVAKDDAQSLNALAWQIVSDPRFAKAGAKNAERMAVRACELTEWKNGDILDTLARAYWEQGDKMNAVKFQQKAIDVADERSRASYTETLNGYKAGNP